MPNTGVLAIFFKKDLKRFGLKRVHMGLKIHLNIVGPAMDTTSGRKENWNGSQWP
jgi:hypothetical protein